MKIKKCNALLNHIQQTNSKPPPQKKIYIYIFPCVYRSDTATTTTTSSLTTKTSTITINNNRSNINNNIIVLLHCNCKIILIFKGFFLSLKDIYYGLHEIAIKPKGDK